MRPGSPDLYQQFFERTPILMGIAELVDDDIRHITDNRAAARFFGRAPEELRGRLASELGVSREDIALWVRHYQESRASGRPSRFEYAHPCADGVRWLSVTTSYLGDSDGERPRFSYVVHDVTEFRNGRDELERESEVRFRRIANSMPQIVWTADASGATTFLNDRWYEYTGQPVQPLERESQLEAIHPDDLPAAAAGWKRALEVGGDYETEVRLRGRDGGYRWFVSRSTPVRDERGAITAWYGTSTDIHEQKRTQELLAEAVRARDDFIMIASHELKTPLTSLRLANQLVRRQIARGDPVAFDADQVRQLAEQNDRQVTRLVRLVDDMLDVSRIRAEKLSLVPVEFDLCDLVREAIERFRPQFIESGCGVPPAPTCGPIIGRWDRVRLEQVINNLFTNAIRYGRGKPVEVSVGRRARSAVLTVHDRGMGIAREHHEKIFERFERAIDANEVSGLGLGLFISRKIVQAHGGTIRVESEPGRGACFRVELPL